QRRSTHYHRPHSGGLPAALAASCDRHQLANFARLTALGLAAASQFNQLPLGGPISAESASPGPQPCGPRPGGPARLQVQLSAYPRLGLTQFFLDPHNPGFGLGGQPVTAEGPSPRPQAGALSDPPGPGA